MEATNAFQEPLSAGTTPGTAAKVPPPTAPAVFGRVGPDSVFLEPEHASASSPTDTVRTPAEARRAVRPVFGDRADALDGADG